MLLWATIAVLTLGVTVIIVWPLFSRRSLHLPPDDDLERRLRVFRDRRDEISREHAAGRLGDGEAGQAQADLLRQMAEELPSETVAATRGPEDTGGATRTARPATSPAGGASRSRASLYVGLVVAVLVPVVALGVYRGVGSPEIALAQRGADPGAAGSTQAQFDALLVQIQERLKANPKDGEAWAVLAEAYKLTGKHEAAIEAFEHAVELLPPSSRLFADYAESTALSAGGDFSGRPTALLERALQVDPNDQKAVALMGAAQFRAGDLPQARRYLKQLLASLPPGSDYAGQIGEVVARIDAELAGRGAPPPSAAAPPGSTPPPAAPRADAPAAVAAAPAPAAAGSPGASPPLAAADATLRGTVSIASGLAQRVPAGAVLFIVARAAEGPRIPVAALRVSSPTLPLDFELSDANAMDPSRLLSATGEISLEARLSGSGTAMRSPGDLYGVATTVKPGEHGIAIRIDQVVGP